MKTLSLKINLKIVILVLIMTTVLAVGTWVTWLWTSLPHDIVRKNLSIEEAQSLVSFPICIPTYLPVGIKSEPQINYDTDSPDIPEVTWIRLVYRRSDSSQKVFEVSQRFTNHDSVSREYPDAESKKPILLWWISPHLSVSRIKPIAGRVEIRFTFFPTNDILWWLYEITEPIEYQSTLTWWIKNNVEYQVSSFLSVDEIKEITESMFECIR